MKEKNSKQLEFITSKETWKRVINYIGINPDMPKRTPVSKEDEPYAITAVVVTILLVTIVPMFLIAIYKIFFN